MNILTLIFQIVLFGITLVKEIRGLVKQVPYFYVSPKKPTILTLLENQEKEKAMQANNILINYQIDMEQLFHKNQVFSRIKYEFEKAGIHKLFKEKGIDEEFGYNLLVQLVLHKRVSLPILVGILRKHFKGNVQETANAIKQACEADLMDWNPTTKMFIVRFDITADVQEDLDRYQYPLPMIVEPLPLSNNKESGYYTTPNSVILKNNHHNDDVCLDHLNKMNKVRLTINQDTSSMISNSWRNLNKPKDGEDKREYQKRVKAFNKYDRTAKDVMSHLSMANTEFYLTHRYDKRGRVYCQGYHVNYQGTEWNKAVIEFTDKEIVNG